VPLRPDPRLREAHAGSKSMNFALGPHHHQLRLQLRAFIDAEITPYANEWDQKQQVPLAIVTELGRRGYLGAALPEQTGGLGLDAMGLGLICEDIARSSASLLSLLTVHGMACQSINRWGTSAQKAKWLPELASGRKICALALTEPEAGSDSSRLATTARISAGTLILQGEKRWISFGQIADLILVFAKLEGSTVALLVEKDAVACGMQPVQSPLGMRASMLAHFRFQDTAVPATNILGGSGFHLSPILHGALDFGRYCIAWGCVGLAEACLAASLRHARTREQFGVKLAKHQLIQRMLTEMLSDTKAAKLLCMQAALLRQTADPASILETSIAKYFSAKTAAKAADLALQIHGAKGCDSEHPVQRFWRDARIMEIIEGSNEIQQIRIAESATETERFDQEV